MLSYIISNEVDIQSEREFIIHCLRFVGWQLQNRSQRTGGKRTTTYICKKCKFTINKLQEPPRIYRFLPMPNFQIVGKFDMNAGNCHR